MYKSWSIIGLRLLSIYLFVSLISQGQMIPALPALFSEEQIVSGFGLAILASFILQIALCFFLWIRADYISDNLLKGIDLSQTQEALNDKGVLSLAVMSAAGFLIVSESFQPAAEIISFRKIDLMSVMLFTAQFLLGLFLILRPSVIWKFILQTRKMQE